MYDIEWSQEEFIHNKRKYEAQGVEILLIDTINNPIEGTHSLLYNPHLLKTYPKGTILVFYCDTGKATKERLHEYQKKFPDKKCISLKGGRGYWRRAYNS